MLPDLRIVIAAVISTFVLTVGVGFYTSSRLIEEPRKSTDSLAALDATPVNRIALSWPAPTSQPEALALDFAVTAKALRNPVRDITNEQAAVRQEPQTPAVRTTTDLAIPPAKTPAEKSAGIPSTIAAETPEPATSDAAPAPVANEAPKAAPEPDIRVAVQYPPILELPPELQAPAVPVTPAAVDVKVVTETPAATGSIAASPNSTGPADDPALADTQPVSKPETQIANRPEPADAIVEDDQEIEQVPTPKPAPKIQTKKTTPKKTVAKKTVAKKVVRRPVRRPPPRQAAPVPNFFNLFTFQQPR